MDSHPAAHQLRCVIPIIKWRWLKDSGGAVRPFILIYCFNITVGGGQNIKDTRQENIGKLFGDYR